MLNPNLHEAVALKWEYEMENWTKISLCWIQICMKQFPWNVEQEMENWNITSHLIQIIMKQFPWNVEHEMENQRVIPHCSIWFCMILQLPWNTMIWDGKLKVSERLLPFEPFFFMKIKSKMRKLNDTLWRLKWHTSFFSLASDVGGWTPWERNTPLPL